MQCKKSDHMARATYCSPVRGVGAQTTSAGVMASRVEKQASSHKEACVVRKAPFRFWPSSHLETCLAGCVLNSGYVSPTLRFA